MNALAVLTRQMLAVTGALAACAVAAVGGATWARAAVLAAAAVLVVLGAVAAAVLRQARRRALGLIVDGRERLPLAALERERRRLLKPRARARLATGLADVLEEALTPRGVPVASASLLADARVVRENASELCGVAALVRGTPASAGGVALVERLLTDRGSPLYGKEVRPLREELRRGALPAAVASRTNGAVSEGQVRFAGDPSCSPRPLARRSLFGPVEGATLELRRS